MDEFYWMIMFMNVIVFILGTAAGWFLKSVIDSIKKGEYEHGT